MGDGTLQDEVIGTEKSFVPSRRDAAIAFLLPVLLLLPFANKALHIDDPMFVWVAEQIVAEPLDYFGGYMDLGTFQMPMYQFNQNPPGFSYYLAPFGAIFGWDEIPLHLSVTLFAGLAGLGVYFLAGRLCRRPLLVACMTVLTPGFLVSASTLMTDVAMVAAYVWGIYFWIRGLDSQSNRLFFISAACISAGILLKYYAITALPLILVYTLMRRQKPGLWIVALLLPIAAWVLFLYIAYLQYGVNLLQIAADTAQLDKVRTEDSALTRAMLTLVYTGGCLAPIALYSFSLLPKNLSICLTVVVGVLVFPLVDGYSFFQLIAGYSDQFSSEILAHLGVMFALALLMLMAAGLNLRSQPTAEGVLLALWTLGTLFFVLRVNHYINARVILPLTPAIAILIIRQWDAREHMQGPTSGWKRAWPLAVGAVLSLWVTLGDYAAAANQRTAALNMVAEADEADVQLHYAGFGGFTYYLEEGGAKALDVESGGLGGNHKVKMQHGDLLAIDAGSREMWRTPPKGMEEVDVYIFLSTYGASTIHGEGQAGFYAHLVGVLPFRLGTVSPLEFAVYRWVGESYETPETPAKQAAVMMNNIGPIR